MPSAIDLDWEPPRKRVLPFRFRIFGWILSRAEFLHRELRDFYHTWYGLLLVWTNVLLWAVAAAQRLTS